MAFKIVGSWLEIPAIMKTITFRMAVVARESKDLMRFFDLLGQLYWTVSTLAGIGRLNCTQSINQSL